MNEIPCTVEGCGYTVDRDDDHWREEMERHVRWIHLQPRDYGPQPVAALFILLVNGMIREEEFSSHVGAVLDKVAPLQIGGYQRSPWYRFAWASVAFSAFCLIVLGVGDVGWLRLSEVERGLFLFYVAWGIFFACLGFRRTIRGMLVKTSVFETEVVRAPLYPDTDSVDDDAGG